MSAVLREGEHEFRPMCETDLLTVMGIEKRAYAFPWTHGIFLDCLRAGYDCWVYLVSTEIVGYGVCHSVAGETHILNLTVDPDHQRRGIGSQILQRFVDFAARQAVDTVLLEVRPSNVAALRLYRSAGFNEVGMRRNYYPAENGKEDALILARVL